MKRQNQRGNLHLVLLSVIIIILGLSLDRPWWRIGALMLLILFVDSYMRYRNTN